MPNGVYLGALFGVSDEERVYKDIAIECRLCFFSIDYQEFGVVEEEGEHPENGFTGVCVDTIRRSVSRKEFAEKGYIRNVKVENNDSHVFNTYTE